MSNVIYGIKRVQDISRGIIQRYAGMAIKRRLWDREYANGRWDCLDNMVGDCLYPHVEKHAKGGSILDLGCGPGSTASELDAASYSTYTGVDISEVAIAKARERTARNGRDQKNAFAVSDLAGFTPTHKYDVILFGDSIYYVPLAQIPNVLRRYSHYLTESGVFLARIFDPAHRRTDIITIIENHFDIVERELYFQSQISVIAFKPHGGGR